MDWRKQGTLEGSEENSRKMVCRAPGWQLCPWCNCSQLYLFDSRSAATLIPSFFFSFHLRTEYPGEPHPDSGVFLTLPFPDEYSVVLSRAFCPGSANDTISSLRGVLFSLQILPKSQNYRATCLPRHIPVRPPASEHSPKCAELLVSQVSLISLFIIIPERTLVDSQWSQSYTASSLPSLAFLHLTMSTLSIF